MREPCVSEDGLEFYTPTGYFNIELTKAGIEVGACESRGDREDERTAYVEIPAEDVDEFVAQLGLAVERIMALRKSAAMWIGKTKT